MLAPKPTGGPAAAAAFERLYRRHVGEVYRYAAAMLPNSADAEDVVQATFLNAFRAFERGQRPQHPLSWLMAIAHNVCRQRFRQQSRRPSEVAFEDDLPAASSDDESPSIDEVQRALGQLGFNQRAALVMRELEGRSYAEIADRLGLSHSAVETLIFRARRALREQLEATLSCDDAGRAVSRQLDGLLPRQERGALRAHLRCCPDCHQLARRMRGQRTAIKALGTLPLPASLTTFSLAGARVAAGIGGRALALKLAGAATAVVVAAGAGYEAVRTPPPVRAASQARAAAVVPAATTASGPRVTHVASRHHAPVRERPVATVAASAAQTTLARISPAAAPSAVTTTPSRRVQADAAAYPAKSGARAARGRPAAPGKSSTTRAAHPGPPASHPDSSAAHAPAAGDSLGAAPCTPLPECVPQTPALPVPPDAQPAVGSAIPNVPVPPVLPHK